MSCVLSEDVHRVLDQFKKAHELFPRLRLLYSASKHIRHRQYANHVIYQIYSDLMDFSDGLAPLFVPVSNGQGGY